MNDVAFVGAECTGQAEEASRCAHGTISVRAQVHNYHKASISNTALAEERHTGVLGSGNEQQDIRPDSRVRHVQAAPKFVVSQECTTRIS